MPKQVLTQKQREVLEFISKSIAERGVPPTVREIAEHLNVKSTNCVATHLKNLERKGFIEIESRKARGIRLVKQPTFPEMQEALSNAFYSGGRVEQGIRLSITNGMGTVLVPAHLFAGNTTIEAMFCDGSATELGVLEGDIAVVRKERLPARSGLVALKTETKKVAVRKLSVITGSRYMIEPALENSVFIVRLDELKDILIGEVALIVREVSV